jgi:predicted DNA-binding protein (MmcQ/YjbR family)
MSWESELSPGLAAIAGRIIRSALARPDTRQDMPWGYPALKVGGKVFLFMGASGGALTMSMKLPASGPFALELPIASRAGYGLGRAGWVTLRLEDPEEADEERLLRWLDESYDAVAPKPRKRG